MNVESAPVVVIGGGIVGASIAWHLAREKKDVILITETIGGVATPKSFCWLNAAGATQKFYYDFRRRSMARWAEMGKELPDLPIHWGGVLACDRTPEERQEFYERQRLWGTSFRRMETAELAALESQVDEAQFSLIKWGLHVPEEGTIEAQAAAAKLIAHAQSLGTKVHETRVTGFLKDDKGRVPGVGQEGLLVNTAPTEKRYLNTLLRLPGLHMRQTLNGRIVFGASFAGGQPGDDPQATAEDLFSQVQKTFKNGDELELSHYTIGVRPEPDDGYPILGSTGLEGLDLAVMHSGVTNAALVGELLAKKIVFGVEDPMLGDYRLDRFKNDAKL
ncbi:d-amino acid dehydrogenase small subunit [Fusarium bulbicola]|nr:d-amino acid dehydrogenase small subunit [Fusarium bulbicola]